MITQRMRSTVSRPTRPMTTTSHNTLSSSKTNSPSPPITIQPTHSCTHTIQYTFFIKYRCYHQVSIIQYTVQLRYNTHALLLPLLPVAVLLLEPHQQRYRHKQEPYSPCYRYWSIVQVFTKPLVSVLPLTER